MEPSYLQYCIVELSATVGQLSDSDYQDKVNEFSEYFKSLLYGIDCGLISPSHVSSNASWGVNRDMEISSITEIKKAISESERGVLNIDIVRCNPCMLIRAHLGDTLIGAYALIPKSFLRFMDGRMVDYRSFKCGFILTAY